MPVAGVLARDPAVLADVARLVPSAVAPTNSRGETLLYLRGAGERQTAVLLDGAPLTVPWDRRLNLALVPAGVVGSLDVVRGPASLAWGPNAAGGALDLVPRALPSDGALTEAEASGGLPARGRLAATALRRRGPWSLTGSADASASAGDALAARLPFSQDAGALRTNTDRRAASALGRVVWEPAGPHRPTLAVTALAVTAAQGVAPEGHLDPAAERVRFWRIPSWQQAALVVRGRIPARVVGLDATAWASGARQTIDQFAGADYDAREGGEESRDRTAGGRLVAHAVGGAGTVRLVAHGHVSTHDEGGPNAEPERFREAGWRLGVEAEGEMGPVALLAGAALDGFDPLKTAGRTSSGGFRSVALVVRAEAPVGLARVWAGVSRAGRFPTLRELFGEALGRFALNPDLRPEATWQGEVGARAEGRRVSGRAAVFVRRTAGTIEQERLPDGRRRRVNLGGSRAVGVEAEAALRLGGAARLDASGTVLHLRGWTDDADGLRLPERPAALGRLALTVLPARGWTAAAEFLATGPAVSLAPGGMADLPASVVLGGRVGYRWAVGRGLLGAFVRVDNAGDAAVFPQAGLPAPGREVRAGLRWVG
ncbi:TonB-dependent receptor [Rubrivirga sp. S365]|uniref:TonB-dependent receptor n=1 Tax=Rubrivirga litoralis TaxID=3075598 RepID=A0ABU3BSZ5_9BACT|nr:MULTISPECIES: TonB-dependent receptor [unclassified Rubrivirga]MDT0632415.1 TonB-dependent receptor [Rubrivirga sp. F394]MDT7855214.1 TonB-dependent receptor [Rubrivirga sp. S365]